MLALRPYQRAAIDAVMSYWAKGGDHPLIELATGTGKSLVIATLIQEVLTKYPDMRIVVLVHVKELVQQDAKAILEVWPSAPIGINSAGLGRRDRQSQVLIASIQSIYKQGPDTIGERDLVIIDECHMIPKSGEGMYQSFLGRLRERVPTMRLVGLTATPYRTGSGRLDQGDGRLFSKIVYTYGIREGIDDGFLSPPISKATALTIDVSEIKTVAGDFAKHELEIAVDQDWITKAAVNEIVEFGAARKSWIAFCTGVDHSYHVRDEIRSHGISCETITGLTERAERDRILRDFKAGLIRCLTNCSVLTTGIDVPSIDMIALLRPTQSPVLYVQIIGRGTRIASNKMDCLVLDFARNISRLGPVDQIKVKKAGEKKDTNEVRAKECPQCKTLLALNVRQCTQCDHLFKISEPDILPKHDARADSERAILSTAGPIWIGVDGVRVFRHVKVGEPDAKPTLRVEYSCGISVYKEWITVEHGGMPGGRAEAWWRMMGGIMPAPRRVDDALDRVSELNEVDAIAIKPEGKWFRVVAHRMARLDGEEAA